MFDAVQIGKYIYFLRKRKGITQVQLAEKMGVSHQAVSNWERGGATPDISLVTRLASLLETTADRILTAGEDGTDVKKESSQNPSDYLEKEKAIKEKIEEKQRTIKEKIKQTQRTIQERKRNMDELRDGLEGVNSECVRESLENALESFEEEVSELEDEVSDMFDELEDMRDDLCENDEFINEMTSEEIEELQHEMKEIADSIEQVKNKKERTNTSRLRETYDNMIAELQERYDDIENEIRDLKEEKADSFLNGIKTDENVTMIKADNGSGEDWDYIQSIAPFASQKTLDKMARDLILKSEDEISGISWSKFSSLIPFLSGDLVDEIALKLVDNIDFEINWERIASIACFASSNTISKMIDKILSKSDKADENIIVSIAPFAQSRDLEKIIMSDDIRINRGLLVKLAPFLNEGVIDRIILANK